MLKISIVTDSMCDLPKDIINLHNIHLVHGIIYVDNQKYISGVDITSEDIENLIEKHTIKTGAPPIGSYYEVYKKLSMNSDYILSIHPPKKLTAMIQSARLAARRLEHPDKVIHFETGVASLGIGLTAIVASKVSQMYDDIDKVKQIVEYYSKHVELIGTIDSFKYVGRTGRIKLKIGGMLATALNIKPVLSLHGTKITMLGKTTNREKAKQILIEKLKERIDHSFEIKLIGLGQFGCLDEAKTLSKKIKSIFSDWEFIFGNADAMIAANTGPGLILLAYLAKKELKLGEKMNE